jgi:alanyl-tRNA synthetase
MTSAEIRQSFLDFFRSKKHTIVPSSSLLPDSPNLLFTNAGMNQFVPIFLGQRAPDVSKWAGVIPSSDTRAADTQKCIRAGGKHNDLEDVGLDTYHLTFFEMLGNWSFGDYFKKESLNWGWELLTKVWGIPPKRLFATVYSPDKSKGDPADFDQEACDIWAEIFHHEGLDPKIHIVYGNKKDNFWMMGDTGPCGPCSEIHFNLLPSDDEQPARDLVNAGSQRCIEIWNHVFIQFNANPDGTYSPLPAKHVDTGMGFDRIAGFYAGTKGFKDYSQLPSAYDTDIFTSLFAAIEKLSGKKYTGSLPKSGTTGETEQEKIDIAFRVIADHIRTLSFSIADGIIPSNEGRGYVLRRILRRAVRYGRSLGFHEPFFYKLVSVLADIMGHVFPEIRVKREHIEEVIQREEEAFNKTLDRGIEIFEANIAYGEVADEMGPHSWDLESALKSATLTEEPPEPFLQKVQDAAHKVAHIAMRLDAYSLAGRPYGCRVLRTAAANVEDALGSLLSPPVRFAEVRQQLLEMLENEIPSLGSAVAELSSNAKRISGSLAFELYDTYGFPLDLTELMARERGLTVDVAGFNKLMEEQRARARAAQKKEIIEVSAIMRGTSSMTADATVLRSTQFVGYDKLESPANVLEIVGIKDKTAVIFDISPLYAEMGGQVGDTGEIIGNGQLWHISNTQKAGNAWLHFLDSGNHASRITHHAAPYTETPAVGSTVTLSVNKPRRFSIQRHHTVTHLLHWALHEVVSKDAVQKGSYVGPEKLTFDFSSVPLTPQQIADVEKLVNERILENAGVSWTEVPYSEVKSRKDIMQFFGEKYGDRVRVVQIGGKPTALDGYSMELCGGTHTRATGEIGLFRIVAESATGAGIRRIEAVAGLEAYKQANDQLQLIKTLAGKVNSPVTELEKKIESLLAEQKDLEKQLKAAQQKQAAETARTLTAKAQTIGSTRAIIEKVSPADGDYLQSIADSLKGQFNGVVVLGGSTNGAVALIATVSPDLTKQIQAGKIIQTIAPIVGGKGGGRPDNARGGGKEVAKLDEALAKAKSLLG